MNLMTFGETGGRGSLSVSADAREGNDQPGIGSSSKSPLSLSRRQSERSDLGEYLPSRQHSICTVLDKDTVDQIANSVLDRMETMAPVRMRALTFDYHDLERQDTRQTEALPSEANDSFKKWCIIGWASAYIVLVLILGMSIYLVTYGSYALSLKKIPPSYRIIIDAGSTKSRVHIMAYDSDTDLIPLRDYSYNTKIKPGISDFMVNEVGDLVLRSDPEQSLREYMSILIEDAKLHVPLGKACQIDICMYATFGMRKLTKENPVLSERIMTGINKILEASPFNNLGARIISVKDEAIGAWVDANLQYLNDVEEPVGVLEMGGGSLQMIADPNNSRTMEGFGIDEAYDQFQKMIEGEKEDPSKMKGWEKNGIKGTGDWDKCVQIVQKMIDNRPELKQLNSTDFPRRLPYKLVGNFQFIRSFLGIKHCPYGMEVAESGQRLCHITWADRHLLKGNNTDYEDGIFSAVYHHLLIDSLSDFIIKGESDTADIQWSRGLIALNTVFPDKLPLATSPIRIADNETRFLLNRVHRERHERRH